MLTIDPTSSTPPYEQIRIQIADLVRDGELVPGTRLPTVRRLAGDLGLAPNTVARSYRELERDEIIQTRGRHGSYIAMHGTSNQRHAQAAAQAYVLRLGELGIGMDEGLKYVRAAFQSR
ncbi:MULTISPECIES: GntR family transcriptional regulator [Cryobacterium]|uniref:GntR family transcriptional regulator n=1 Tax=Cryobacterium breve TaxID=1259258 RepID=A0ABY2IVS7_9MICO|nr:MULTISPECIES: GntR family transcriptional regulator [Cryobacterium]TFC95892.1 GntR family transcriptional regulator [Cryobacterium breve]TFC98031.1 GntR family transcriptional regulator [Cryobacterium sp. TmT3-12]